MMRSNNIRIKKENYEDNEESSDSEPSENTNLTFEDEQKH